MVDYKEIESALGIKSMMTDAMQAALQKWYSCGIDKMPVTPESNGKTLDLPWMICNRLAGLTVLEAEPKITGSDRADWIDRKIRQVMAPGKISCLSRALMLGSGIWLPYQSGYRVGVSFVSAAQYIPVAEDVDGNLSEVVIVDTVPQGDKVYHRLQWMHVLEGPMDYHGTELDTIELLHVDPPAQYPCVQVINKAYMSEEEGKLGKETKLTCLNQWADTMPVAYLYGIDYLPLGYYSNPIDNTVSPDCGMGMSMAEPAWRQIADADKQADRLDWEYDAGALAIDTDQDYLRSNGEKPALPHGRERLYRGYDTAGVHPNSPFYNVFAPNLRDGSYLAGLNQYLRNVESHAGLAFGELSDVSDVEKTAKEIIASKQTMYRTVSMLQASVEDMLRQLVKALDFWADCIYPDAPAHGEINETYKWDDSIILSREDEMAQWMREVEAGIRSKVEYRMHFYGEDLDAAKAAVDAAGVSPDDVLDGVLARGGV